MKTLRQWHFEARETIRHEWTVEAETREQAREIASNGCPDDTCEAEFGDIIVRSDEELAAALAPCAHGVIARTCTSCHPSVQAELLKALIHAQNRLNEIEHDYDQTDFKLIRGAIEKGERAS